MRQLTLIITVLLFPAFISAQNDDADREALKRLMADTTGLQIGYKRGDAINLAAKLNPKPAVSAEAQRFMARGLAAMKNATSERDFADAAAEFDKAVIAAPWMADAHYNLAIALSKVGDYDGAKQSLRLYMLAAPDAADFAQAKDLMYEMEYKYDKLRKPRRFVLSSLSDSRDMPFARGSVEGEFGYTMNSPPLSVRSAEQVWEIKIEKFYLKTDMKWNSKLKEIMVYVHDADYKIVARGSTQYFDEAVGPGRELFPAIKDSISLYLPMTADLSQYSLNFQVKFTCSDGSLNCQTQIWGKKGIFVP